MGAGITVAQGINRAEPDTVNIAFIGDSTFFHTGIPGMINAVYNRAGIIIVILDNFTTAMTGSQPHPGTGENACGCPAGKIDIYAMVSAMGVKNIVKANPFDLKSAEEAARMMFVQEGVRVIIFEAPCIMVSGDRGSCVVDPEKCTGCRVCIARLGCPAISFAGGRAAVDQTLCTGCGICAGLCMFKAIAAADSKGKEKAG
jgi:indolepyruvate ferredoxin oxidoreductase alpha subunit